MRSHGRQVRALRAAAEAGRADVVEAAPAPGGGADLAARAAVHAILERLLLENLLPFWYPGALDDAHGGYRLHHDAAGRWLGPAPKRAVMQARTLWFFARLARSPYGSDAHLAAAAHGYAFLRAHLWDAEHGGVFWEVDATGHAATRPEKHLYAQAFALYALAEYAAASGDRGARDLAVELVALCDRVRDTRDGGYHESHRRDWTPELPGTRNVKSLPVEAKSMNTHLHLLEAFTRHHELAPDDRTGARVAELAEILSTRVVHDPPGACLDLYAADWQPLAGAERRVSYGHDLETITLLIAALEGLGRPPGDLLPRYRTLFAHADRHGRDRRRGGFYASGPIGAAADRREKVAWVQAEALLATLALHRLTGECRLWACFLHTLEWIVRRQVDWRRGEWHAQASWLPHRRGLKAGPWKGPYHAGRALLEALGMLAP